MRMCSCVSTIECFSSSISNSADDGGVNVDLNCSPIPSAREGGGRRLVLVSTPAEPRLGLAIPPSGAPSLEAWWGCEVYDLFEEVHVLIACSAAPAALAAALPAPLPQ